MSKTLKLGLGNSLNEKTVIFHGGISARDSFGRVTDLLSVWAKKEHGLSQKLAGDLRVLVQGLLEFGFPANYSSIGRLESAIEDQKIFVALRFENFIVEENDNPEKKLAQFWLNSEESSLIKRILYPHDLVEVRFLRELNLLEWRIIRSIGEASINLESLSFQVFSEIENELVTEHKQFIEMGDVQYDDWISEVYKNPHGKSKSGELFQSGESLQSEEEWARIVSDRDQKTIDETVMRIQSQQGQENLSEVTVSGDQNSTDIEETKIIGDQSRAETAEFNVSDDLNQLDTASAEDVQTIVEGEHHHYLEETEITITDHKSGIETSEYKISNQDSAAGEKRKNSFSPDVVVLNEKVKQYENLLKQKEKQNQKMGMEISVLQKKLDEAMKGSQAADSRQAQVFKDKAMQMFEMVKALQQDKQNLEKTVFELKRGGSGDGAAAAAAGKTPNEAPGLMLQIEELNKKAERLSRALEAEKQKMAGILERAVTAEKEAQSSTAMISDFEKKVETVSKMAQQHKKETEQVKQKLIQVDAEKNKVKNDLLKAQAQIQTLMKRQAA